MSAMGSVSRFIMTHVAMHPPPLPVELAALVRKGMLPAGGSAMSIALAAGETSLHFQIFGRGLPAIVHQLEVNTLAFVERCQPGAFNRRDMNEHVLPAIRRLNEAVAFGRVEPLHCSGRHLVGS